MLKQTVIQNYLQLFHYVKYFEMENKLSLGKDALRLSKNAGNSVQMDIFLEPVLGSLKQEISDYAFVRMVFQLNSNGLELKINTSYRCIHHLLYFLNF